MPKAKSKNRRPRRLKGFMIDAARLVESCSYYHRLIDFCAEWGYNTIVFRLTDDEGCALRLKQLQHFSARADTQLQQALSI